MPSLDVFLNTPWLLYLTVTLVSLCIGSFLNVVILRLPKMMHQDWRCQCEEFLEVPEAQRKKKKPSRFPGPPPPALPAATRFGPGRISRW